MKTLIVIVLALTALSGCEGGRLNGVPVKRDDSAACDQARMNFEKEAGYLNRLGRWASGDSALRVRAYKDIMDYSCGEDSR